MVRVSYIGDFSCMQLRLVPASILLSPIQLLYLQVQYTAVVYFFFVYQHLNTESWLEDHDSRFRNWAIKHSLKTRQLIHGYWGQFWLWVSKKNIHRKGGGGIYPTPLSIMPISENWTLPTITHIAVSYSKWWIFARRRKNIKFTGETPKKFPENRLKQGKSNQCQTPG